MALNDQQVKTLLLVTAATEAEEIDCQAFLEHMAGLVEARAAGRALPPQVVAHERLCANCREETAALAVALSDEPA